MRSFTLLLLSALAACDAPSLLPLVAEDGSLSGTYDPASGELSVAGGGDAVRDESSDEAALSDGAAVVDWALQPGDVLEIVGADGSSEVVVGDADALDGLSTDDAETRLPGCYPSIR
jgi:hypothetical protein